MYVLKELVSLVDCHCQKSMDLSDECFFCKQVSITSSMLFEDATLLPHPEVVKNGLMPELCEIQRGGSLCWTAYGSWVHSLLD